MVVEVVAMSRLSFRPRPLDIHKKLPILKSAREFEDDDPTAAAVAAARAGVLLRHSGAELTATATATDGEVIKLMMFELTSISTKCSCSLARRVFFWFLSMSL